MQHKNKNPDDFGLSSPIIHKSFQTNIKNSSLNIPSRTVRLLTQERRDTWEATAASSLSWLP